MIKILYAGDSALGGSANYLLGILNRLSAEILHLPPWIPLKPNQLDKPYDVIIFSDYSRKTVSNKCQELIANQVRNGTGFLMIGGWGSFSGPFGNWRGSIIENILPVRCRPRDDRQNFMTGCLLLEKVKHSMFKDFKFQDSPVLCGLNKVTLKPGSQTILGTREILQKKNKTLDFSLSLDKTEYPLLVIDKDKNRRIAAFTTDIAPHWCGGLVDWGTKRKILKVNAKIQVEVGNRYVEFLSHLINWLAEIKTRTA